MTQHYGLILDGLVIVLLCATIVYAAILNRRLKRLRDGRAELEKATRSFAEAALRADAGIKGLKQVADDSGHSLQAMIARAETLRDEMTFLVDAGESAASRMERAATRQDSRLSVVPEAPDIGCGDHPEEIADEAPASQGRAPRSRAAAPKSGRRRGGPGRDLLKAIESMR